MLETVGGSCISPFVWNQSAVSILRGLLVQPFPLVQSSMGIAGGYQLELD